MVYSVPLRQHTHTLSRFTMSIPSGILRSTVGFNLLVGLLYTLSAQVGMALALGGNGVAVVWPPLGVAMAAFWLGGWRVAPAVALADAATTLIGGDPLWMALCLAVLNTLQAAVLGLGLARWQSGRSFHWNPSGDGLRTTGTIAADLRGVSGLALASALGPVVSAPAGALLLMAGGQFAAASWLPAMLTWWLADATGVLLLAPWLVLLAHRGPWRNWSLEHWAALVVTMLCAGGLFVFAGRLPGPALVWPALMWPLALWSGLRLGLAVFSCMVVLTGVLAIGGTSHGLGVLAGLPLQHSIIALQALLSVFALSGYAIAAAIRSRDQVLQSLQSERQLLTTGPVVVMSWGPGTGLPIRYASPNVVDLLGYSAAQLLHDGQQFAALTHAGDVARLAREVQAHIAAHHTGYEQRYRVQHRAGHWVHVLDFTRVDYDEHGEVIEKRGYLLDRSQEVLATREHAKLLQAMDQSPELIIITNTAGHIEYVNDTFCRTTGYQRQQTLGQNPRFLSAGKMPRSHYTRMWRQLLAGKNWEGELIDRCKDGTELTLWTRIHPVRDEDGQVTQYLAMQIDVTERKQTEAQLQRLSRFDSLTGLANRASLMTALERAMRQATESGCPFALLVLNVQRFKWINDAQGYEAGDELLRKLAELLAGLLRPGDLAARLAADQFALLLPQLQPDTANATSHVLAVVERVQTQASAGLQVKGVPLAVDLSCGATLLPLATPPGDVLDTAADALGRAETALNRARIQQDRGVAFFDASMGESARQRFELEHELRHGVANGELRLFMQSQVNASAQVVSAEVLVRWQHPKRGLLAPGVFIPLAEESDLIILLEQWVFNEVLEMVAQLEMQDRPLHVSVNLSARHFRQANFVPWLHALLQQTGAPTTRLTLEITESVVIDRPEEAIAKMHVLRAMGLHFALDDFGTGYSSLSYLKRLPVSELKIDKAFVQDAPTDADDAALVQTIMAVAGWMNLRVVAEGVETQEQADFLLQRGELLLQGYLYSRPQPVADWLAAHWPGPASVV